MKAAFVTALTCVISSLLALVALSATSVVPSSTLFHARFIMVVACLFVFWVFLTLWARTRLHALAPYVLLNWLRRTIVGMGGLYATAVLGFATG